MNPEAIVAALSLGTLLLWAVVEVYLGTRGTSESEVIQRWVRINSLLRFVAVAAGIVLLYHLFGQP